MVTGLKVIAGSKTKNTDIMLQIYQNIQILRDQCKFQVNTVYVDIMLFPLVAHQKNVDLFLASSGDV